MRDFEMLNVNQIISEMKQLFLKILFYSISIFTFIGLFHKSKGIMGEGILFINCFRCWIFK